MQEDKKPLREALNLRVDSPLAREVERIGKLHGESASEVARRLLAYGAEVERRLEAQKLMRHYENEYDEDVAGRIVIRAEFVPYTWQEVAQMTEDLESSGRSRRHPTWEDLLP